MWASLVCSRCDDGKKEKVKNRGRDVVAKAEQEGMAVGFFVEAIAEPWACLTRKRRLLHFQESYNYLRFP